MVIAAALLLAAAGPSAAPGAWITADDYPAEAMRAGEEGRVVVELTVDRTGAISRCAVAVSSGSGALDAATCRLVRERGRYAPAHDEQGRAVAAVTRLSFRWTLPSAPTLAQQKEEGVFVLDRGRITSCSGPLSGGGTPPPGLCESYGDLLREIVGDAYAGARTITLTLGMTAGEQPPPPRTGTRFIVADAVFTLGADQRVADCRMREPLPAALMSLADLCAAATAASPKYDGKPGDRFTILFTAVVE